MALRMSALQSGVQAQVQAGQTKTSTFRVSRRCAAAITTKMYMRIEYSLSVPFLHPQTLLHPTPSFSARAPNIYGEFVQSRFLPINPTFLYWNAPNLKHVYKTKVCIYDVNVTKIEQGSFLLRGDKYGEFSDFVKFFGGRKPQIWTYQHKIWLNRDDLRF